MRIFLVKSPLKSSQKRLHLSRYKDAAKSSCPCEKATCSGKKVFDMLLSLALIAHLPPLSIAFFLIVG
jgi:hypothetical protein